MPLPEMSYIAGFTRKKVVRREAKAIQYKYVTRNPFHSRRSGLGRSFGRAMHRAMRKAGRPTWR